MKVLCIKRCTENDKGINNVPAPEVGEECTVIEDKSRMGKVYYRLAEYLEFKNYHQWFDANNFVWIDTDLDETILVNDEWEEKVCEPVNR